MIFVSVFWGLIAAVAASMVTFGVMLGLVWALLFGDHPWPGWVWPLLIGAVSVIAGLSTGAVVGRGLWMHLQQTRAASPRAARLQIWGFLLAGLIAAALLATWIAHES